MRGQQINRVSSIGLLALSLAALLPVLPAALRAVLTGQMPILEPDEGAGAHNFQLSILSLAPTGLLFLATADWTQPLRTGVTVGISRSRCGSCVWPPLLL